MISWFKGYFPYVLKHKMSVGFTVLAMLIPVVVLQENYDLPLWFYLVLYGLAVVSNFLFRKLIHWINDIRGAENLNKLYFKSGYDFITAFLIVLISFLGNQ